MELEGAYQLSAIGYRPMRIGLNAHLLSFSRSYRGAGISWYIHNLLLHLPQADQDNEYIAFLSERGADFPSLKLRLSRLPTIRPPLRILWEQFIQPIELAKESIDILHSLAFVQPVICPCPAVITIYDLSFLLFPEAFKSLNRTYLSLFTPYSARRADRVIAISASTKEDIVRHLGVDPGRIDVVYPGVDEAFRPIADRGRLAAFREKHGLPERLILFVGTIEPRKNVERLVRAYARLRKEGNLPHKLVIGGAEGWLYTEVFATVEEMGLGDDVILPGYIPRDELLLWYNAADVFVYPSLYEGFGLPPLEAMACGTPVIASNASSLPEVVGEAGLLVDPYDVEGMAEAMFKVLTDEELREGMRRKGLERAKGFSWLKMARETVKVYGHIGGDRGDV